MRRYRVLVVDDNEANRLICREIFEHLGCVVNAVEGGEAALTLVASISFDLICLDRFMPGMFGDEVAVRLPAELFVDAWSTEASNLSPRFDGVLPKPITIAAAAGVLARAIAARESRLRSGRLPRSSRRAERSQDS